MYWQVPEVDLHCLLLRTPLLHLCGYVGVSPYHPLHGVYYADLSLYAHGGLTFSGCYDLEELTDQGVPADVWWVGFDCGHYMDLVPGMEKFWVQGRISRPSGVYRTVEFVVSEIESLCRQMEDGITLEIPS